MVKEMNKTFNIMIVSALLLISMAAIVLIGGSVISGYSKVLRVETTASDENVTLVNATAVALTHEWVQSIESVAVNNTFLLTKDTNYTEVNIDTAVTGKITLIDLSGAYGTNSWTLVNYTYLADSTAQGFADDFNTGLAIFAAFVGVIAIAIVGKSIVDMYKGGGFA